MTVIDIEYCAPCGLRDGAIDIQTAILEAVEDKVERVSLTPGHDGVIIVRVDGEQVFHSGEDDYDQDTVVADIVADVEQRL